MMRFSRAARALGLLLAMGALLPQRAQAASVPTNPAHEDLLVSFTANLSVKIDGLEYSTRTLANITAGQTFVPSSATVTNDSAGLTEKFQLHTFDDSALPAASKWTVAPSTGAGQGGVYCAVFLGDPSCPGPDSYALQALFISSANTTGCPSATANRWDIFKSTVAATPMTYTSTRFADSTVVSDGGSGLPDVKTGPQDGNMLAVSGGTDGRGKRGLCVRITMPSASTTVGLHTIRMTVTAVVGN